jgi:hypothetical protein
MPDYIPWKVMNCERVACPLMCCRVEEIEAMTGEKVATDQPTWCPGCLRPVKWELRDLFNDEGERIHPYCHGTVWRLKTDNF